MSRQARRERLSGATELSGSQQVVCPVCGRAMQARPRHRRVCGLSLHRELRTLADAGLLVRQEVSRQVHYRANGASPVFAELADLLRKTSGLADVLRDALEPLGGKIAMAFVYSSMAAGTERATSDVDVMVIGSPRPPPTAERRCAEPVPRVWGGCRAADAARQRWRRTCRPGPCFPRPR